ncbi:MAG: cupin domain-containing protein [Acidobacteriota bacterium]|nr:cupin domain-containing protein [Acidobacteriota bacterium]
MAPIPDGTDEFFFFNTRVTVRVPFTAGADTVSVLEHRAPVGDSPPLHRHVNEDEIFHVLEGTFRFRVGDRDVTAGAGEWLLVPKGVVHSYLVTSTGGGHWLTVTTQTDFERFVRAIGRPATGPGLPAPSGPPTPAQVAELTQLAAQFGIELVGPPLHGGDRTG